MSLAQVMLYVVDLERMCAFYEGALGLTVTEAREGWISLDAGGVVLALHAVPPEIASQIAITRPPKRRSDTPYKLTFRLSDPSGAREKIARSGGTAGPLMEGSRFEALDPEGNVFLVRS
jgi:catechol 2,3-dioxygenase-like lactoylglutathione lyase family enzyme